MTESQPSLAEVKKMVEELGKMYDDAVEKPKTMMAAKYGKNSKNEMGLVLLSHFPLLAQTLLNLMEDNEEMKEALQILQWGSYKDGGNTIDFEDVEQCSKYAGQSLSSLHYDDW